MKVPCEIDNIRTLKSGMKIVINIGDKETSRVMKDIYNFMDKPITAEFLIDGDKARELMNQISSEQRKKIFAILKDMENHIGEDAEALRAKTMEGFAKATDGEDFSLSDCSKEKAGEYIEYLIRLCFNLGVPLKDNPMDAFDDVKKYLAICLEMKKCSVCGKPGETHHWNAIGMGRDRKKYDDHSNRKICLCREHHTEVETIGRDTFAEKYHVEGIEYKEG